MQLFMLLELVIAILVRFVLMQAGVSLLQSSLTSLRHRLRSDL
jgi:hypothetical protein